MRQLYSDELLSRTTYFDWLLAQLASLHLGQLPFILFLLEDVQQDIVVCSSYASQLLDGVLTRLSEVRDLPHRIGSHRSSRLTRSTGACVPFAATDIAARICLDARCLRKSPSLAAA